MPSRVSVFIVDESALSRRTLASFLEQEPSIEVLGAVEDPRFAWTRMARRWPDVVILDVGMPRQDGLTFLRELMAHRPTPVVVYSSLSEHAAMVSIRARIEGAVAVVAKPEPLSTEMPADTAQQLLSAIVNAAQRALQRRTPTPTPTPQSLRAESTVEKLVAIGVSTGGVRALETVFRELSPSSPGIVVVQHMPENFTAAFSQRLNSVMNIEVLEAQGGERVTRGRVLVAPGDRHLTLKRQGLHYVVEVSAGPRVNRHRPSVDVLFYSVAQAAGRNALGIIMTGMGDDGADGLKAMRDAGAVTLGQDEATCVVYGMPCEARKRGAVEREVSLHSLGEEIERFGRGR